MLFVRRNRLHSPRSLLLQMGIVEQVDVFLSDAEIGSFDSSTKFAALTFDSNFNLLSWRTTYRHY
jgi:hypothetical protein